ncbi:MAG: DUF2442 domain-containing protein [Acidobacteria bacterium]|jgi:hypothetical protein|nr:DUF2442 domain-containing protein [Acidobacteriota bacterium]
MIIVVEAQANEEFSLNLKFSDGRRKRFDAKPYLDYEVFKPLKDLNYFKRIKIAFGTVQWTDEQDISPETLCLESKEISKNETILNRLNANLEA